MARKRQAHERKLRTREHVLADLSVKMNYKQLDELLIHLGFSRARVEPKWLRYEHAPSNTLIVLADKKPSDPVRITDAVSARQHLIEKGLLTALELDAFLSRNLADRQAVSAQGEKRKV